jgi:hypothetical protein
MMARFRLILVAGIVSLTLPLAGVGPASVEASRCDMPTGFIGSKNMLLSPSMIEIMADHTAAQGDAGMRHANALTTAACAP